METLIGITVIALSLALGIPFYRKHKRQKLMNSTAPNEWETFLHEEVPYLDKLPPQDKKKLWGLIHIFLDEIQHLCIAFYILL